MALLKWYKPTDHPQDSDEAIAMAHGFGGRYSIQKVDGGFILWLAGDEFTYVTASSVEQAKNTAEDDFAARLAALLAEKEEQS